jgi:hypothetical protein
MNIYATCGDKSEIRIPKSETSSKSKEEKIPKQPMTRWSFFPSDFEFVSDFDIQISDLRLSRVRMATVTT